MIPRGSSTRCLSSAARPVILATGLALAVACASRKPPPPAAGDTVPHAEPESAGAPSVAASAGRAAAEEQPADSKEVLALAFRAISKQDLDAARGYLERVPEGDPAFTLAQHNLALIHEERGDPDGAIRILERLREAQPGSVEVLTDLAWQYYVKGDYDPAIRYGREALALAPAYPLPWYNLALCYVAVGDAGLAMETYGNAVKRDRGHAIFKDALKDLIDYVGQNPGDPVGLYSLARLYGHAGRFDLEKASLLACLDADPPDSIRRAAERALPEVDRLLEEERAKEEKAGQEEGPSGGGSD